MIVDNGDGDDDDEICGLAFQSKNQKKSRATANHVAEETYGSVPHSFVFHRGQVGKNVGQLIQDVRQVMMPFTAESLKVRLQIKKKQLCFFLLFFFYPVLLSACLWLVIGIG